MHKDKAPISLLKSSSRSFTLVELIIVIIIVGILAAVGISQYSKTVEKSRGAEARMIIGNIRQLAYEYRLTNGSIVGATNADFNIGTAADQIPGSCRGSHWFQYNVSVVSEEWVDIQAWRCTANGKTPQWNPYGYLQLHIRNFATPQETAQWQCCDNCGSW